MCRVFASMLFSVVGRLWVFASEVISDISRSIYTGVIVVLYYILRFASLLGVTSTRVPEDGKAYEVFR